MNDNKELRNRGVSVSALIIFSAVYVLLAAFTVLDPIGLLGLLLIPVTGAFLAFLIFVSGSAAYALLTAVSIGVCLLVSGNIAVSLIPLIPMTFGIFLGLVNRLIRSRTYAIAVSSFICVLIVCFILCLIVYQLKGSLSVSLLRSLIDEASAYIKELCSEFVINLNGETVNLINPEELEIVLPLAFAIMPSFVFSFMMIGAYISSYVLLLICKAFRLDDQLMQCEWHITMSRISAVLLIFAYFITVFQNIHNNFTLLAVAANITQILILPFSVIGFRIVIFGLRFQKTRKMMIILLVLFGLMLLFTPDLALMMIAVYGLFYTLGPKVRISSPPPDDNDN